MLPVTLSSGFELLAPPEQKYPGLQLPLTSLCPEYLQNNPGSHGIQSNKLVWPKNGWYVPGGHAVGTLEPSKQK
jgi:hypothetical protein